jgi:hypothetical protein
MLDLKEQFLKYGLIWDELSHIDIIGYGALLSQVSAKKTFPDLKDFRIKYVKGWIRVFNHPALIYFERNIAIPVTGEVSDLSIEPGDDTMQMPVSVFSISKDEIVNLFYREDEFKYTVIPFFSENSKVIEGCGIACTSFSSDEEYINCRIVGKSKAAFKEIWGAQGISSVWSSPDNILPCRIYLRHCFLAVQKQSRLLGNPQLLNYFLETTFLNDTSPQI